jgi:hypothetical protein
MCKRVLGRMRETKVTDTELNWLYSSLIAKQPIDPMLGNSGKPVTLETLSLTKFSKHVFQE